MPTGVVQGVCRANGRPSVAEHYDRSSLFSCLLRVAVNWPPKYIFLYHEQKAIFCRRIKEKLPKCSCEISQKKVDNVVIILYLQPRHCHL